MTTRTNPVRSSLGVRLLALLLLGTAPLAGCGAAQRPQGEVRVSRLNDGVSERVVDGVRVIHKRTPSNAVVQLSVLIDGGSAGHSDAQAAAESVALEAATDGGPAGMARSDYKAWLDARGASIGADAGLDYHVVSVSAVRPYLHDVWALASRTLQKPAFDAANLELIRERRMASFRSELDDPDDALRLLARRAFFVGHPYATRPVGTPEAVGLLDVDALRAAWSGLWVRSRLTVVVVGDLDEREVDAEVSAAFAALPEGAGFSRPSVPPVTPRPAAVNVVERSDMPTNYVLGLFPIPSSTEPDYPAIQIGLAILSDKLFEEVRTKRNLTYAVAAGSTARRASQGSLYVTTTDPVATLAVMQQTVTALIEQPLTDKELRDHVEAWLTEYYMNSQSNAEIASLLGAWELTGTGREQADTHIEALRALTPAQVSTALGRWLRGVQFTVLGAAESVQGADFTSR